MTIDPVGNFLTSGFFERVRQGAGQWLNVNAVGGNWWDTPNIIAGIGGDYGTAPRGIAHGFMEAPTNHANFGTMLNTSTFNGQTLEQRLSGRFPKDSMR